MWQRAEKSCFILIDTKQYLSSTKNLCILFVQLCKTGHPTSGNMSQQNASVLHTNEYPYLNLCKDSLSLRQMYLCQYLQCGGGKKVKYGLWLSTALIILLQRHSATASAITLVNIIRYFNILHFSIFSRNNVVSLRAKL